jgi:hypothetical protein
MLSGICGRKPKNPPKASKADLARLDAIADDEIDYSDAPVRIPEYPPTYSDNIRPPVPGYPPTFGALQ